MPSTISQSERSAIDKYLRRKKLKQIPAGQSGLPGLLWDEKVGGLRYVMDDGARKPVLSAAYNRRQSLAADSRRREVAKLYAKGKTKSEIARLMKVSETTIRSDLRTLEKRQASEAA